MDLSTYLCEHDQRVDRDGAECVRLARSIGSTPNYVYMMALKHKRPGHALARLIEAHTGGKVTRHDLRPDIWPAAEPKQMAA